MSYALYEGQLVSQDTKYAIVVSRFNELITQKLLGGAVDCLKRHGALESHLFVSWCPGAFEIPLVALEWAKSQKVQGIICLGAVIRGQTPHFDYVCSEVSKGVAKVALDYSLPVSFGVLTVDSIEQALERAGTKAGNKGWEAALTAIEMTSLLKNIRNQM